MLLMHLWLWCPLVGQLPELSEGQMILDGKEPINISIGHLVPCVFDWNHDGKKDLIIGQYDKAKIRLYLNKGTDEKPEFEGFEYVKAGGKDISLESG